MSKVFDLAAFRERRAKVKGVIPPRPPDGPMDSQIRISLQPDGTHRVSLRGAYATTQDLAVEAMADAIAFLMEQRRAMGDRDT
ncbi:hypothetical protein HTY52_13000 [Cupriavidus taiwanensis]|uniref:hypothetical protein n=1 Tax=Cupriavidus taiwanensis TaxID=164546 RepID=UPI001572EA33|nr:hypothetical protein [Cupriavidus taiwanensis]NSX14994.1 hypothetical protein [Cupriavidus taiwanensis]